MDLLTTASAHSFIAREILVVSPPPRWRSGVLVPHVPAAPVAVP